MVHLKSFIILGLLWPVLILGQAKITVPADSLLQHKLNPVQRLALHGIAGWQRYSYGHPGVNCQFEPSCSHFTALAIDEYGFLAGTVVGMDRVVRCNPAARDYHHQSIDPSLHQDGRLVEPLLIPVNEKLNRSPALAATLSLIPGLGRIYAGRPVDGFLSMFIVGGLAYATNEHHKAGNRGWTILDGSLTLLLWSADIYGAYWSAAHRRS